MEITLEKIELVKDRTGVSYKEAKDALEVAEGSVVDAIIAIEETVDISKGNKTNEFVSDTMDKVKELVKKGNISKITVKKGEDTIVNIPVNVGVVGALVAPWGVIAAALATVGFKCTVELTTTDGNVIDVTERAGNFANDVKEKGSVVIDEVVEKGTGTYNSIKEAAVDKYNKFKAKQADVLDEAEDAVEDVIETVCDACGAACEKDEKTEE